MKCSDVLGFMGPYLDSELEPTCIFRIQEHLGTCDACQARYAQEEALEARIALALQPDLLPADEALWQRSIVGIRQSVSSQHSPLSRLIRSSLSHAGWISLVASLLFLAALACAGLGLRHRYAPPTPANHGSGPSADVFSHGDAYAHGARV